MNFAFWDLHFCCTSYFYYTKFYIKIWSPISGNFQKACYLLVLLSSHCFTQWINYVSLSFHISDFELVHFTVWKRSSLQCRYSRVWWNNRLTIFSIISDKVDWIGLWIALEASSFALNYLSLPLTDLLYTCSMWHKIATYISKLCSTISDFI